MTFQLMGKSIYEKQSNPLLIQCMYAQRRYYTYAKLISGIYFVVCVLLVCVFAVLKATLHSEIVSGLSIVLSIAAAFGSFVAGKYSSKMKEIAAGIQQFIDISLYSDNPYEKSSQQWNCPLDHHKIIELVSRFPQKGFNSNDKWYEDYSEKQYWEQIYFCQKENIRWDGNLRKHFSIFCNSILALIAIAIIALSFLFNPTILRVLSFVPWISPFVKYMISFNRHMKKDQIQITQMKNKADSVLEIARAHDVDMMLKRENELQDKLFEHRKQALLIPNFFYKICRSKQQQNEEQIAQNEKNEDRK